MALTQQQVVRRAVDLMAEVGLEALTLRRLATELGVSAPTLYWHVRNKRQLLDLMAEALVSRVGRSTTPAPGQPWWEWLAEPALPGVEQVLGSLVAVGFPPDEALRTVLSIGNYVIGCAVEHQAEAARERDPERDARLLERAGELPNLRAAMAGLDRPGSAAGEAGFEHGLALLIEGVRANHAQLVTAAAGQPPGG